MESSLKEKEKLRESLNKLLKINISTDEIITCLENELSQEKTNSSNLKQCLEKAKERLKQFEAQNAQLTERLNSRAYADTDEIEKLNSTIQVLRAQLKG